MRIGLLNLVKGEADEDSMNRKVQLSNLVIVRAPVATEMRECMPNRSTIHTFTMPGCGAVQAVSLKVLLHCFPPLHSLRCCLVAALNQRLLRLRPVAALH